MPQARGFDVITYQKLSNNAVYIRVNVTNHTIILQNPFTTTSTAILFVPEGSLSDNQTSDWATYFKNIVEM